MSPEARKTLGPPRPGHDVSGGRHGSDPVVDLDVTDDAFLGGRLRLLQPRRGYRAGVDAVLLAASVADQNGARLQVLDVGAGVGTVGLCVAGRIPAAHVTLLEPETAFARLASVNATRNDLAQRTRVAIGPVGAPAARLAELGLVPDSFDHVLANPPFHVLGRGTRSPLALKSGAHAMPEGDLDAWARFMARMAQPGGIGAMIHLAEALPSVLAALSGRFGGLDVLPIQPRAGQPAIRVIVRGTKGSRAPLTLRPALVLHEDGGGSGFAPQASAILRDGAGLCDV